MAGTDSTYIGMGSFGKSNTNTPHNVQDVKLANPNGDVVDNSAGALDNTIQTHETSLADARGALRRRYSSPSAIYPNSSGYVG